MSSNNSNEPVLSGIEDLRDILDNYARNTTSLMAALHESAESDECIVWRPHLTQLHNALAHFAAVVRDELENLGAWRADDRALDEIHEFVWEEGERLVCWLNRMLGVN